MARAKSKTQTEDQVLVSKVEGDVYVSVVGGGSSVYRKTRADAQRLMDLLPNPYIQKEYRQLRSILWSEYFTIEIERPTQREDGTADIDTKLSQRVMQMVEAPDVDWWSSWRQIWEDCHAWGCGLVNPVWDYVDSELRIVKWRRLPPETFCDRPRNVVNVREWSDLLKGIVVEEDGSISFYQTVDKAVNKLTNVLIIKDPASPGMLGESSLAPILPFIGMVDFAWSSQMQKVNRIGAPTMFIKFPKELGGPRYNPELGVDDYKYAADIIRNWGKGSGYVLKDNMEVVFLTAPDSASAIETILAQEKMIHRYFDPSAMIAKDGPSLGGNAAAQEDLTTMWAKGEHRWMEGQYERALQTWLNVNGWIGYVPHIQIQRPKRDTTESDARLAEIGERTRVLDPNEVRVLLKHQPKTPEQLVEGMAMWDAIKPAPMSLFDIGMPPMGEDEEEESDEGREEEGQGFKVDSPAEQLTRRLVRHQQQLKKRIVKSVAKNEIKAKKAKKEEQPEVR
jgi:hypothetical protein